MVKVFDLDGTILDSNGIWRTIDEIFVRQRGRALTPEYNEYVAHAIFPDAARFTRAYYHLEESEEEIMAAWLDLAWRAYSEELALKPGAREYLDACSKKGEKMVLYTSGEPRLCRVALERHGIASHFQNCYFAQVLKLEKKYTDSFSRLSALLGEAPEDCILFDDSPIACRCAKEANWKVIGILDPFFQHQEDALRSSCDRCIGGFAELLRR